MEYSFLRTYRQQNPSAKLETAPILCPDGVTRDVTLSYWCWEVMGVVIDKEYVPDLQFFIDNAWRCVKDRRIDPRSLTADFERELTWWATEFFYDWQNFCAKFGVTSLNEKMARHPDKPSLITIFGSSD